MKKIPAFLICILAGSALYAAEPAVIKSIREYYSDTLKRIKSGSLQKREIMVSNPVTPGASPTTSRLLIYYEVLEGQDGRYEYNIIRIENYYQYPASVFYEEFLYGDKGDLMFYYGRRGFGDTGRVEAVKWEYDERFYFHNDSLVRVMFGGGPSDRPTADQIKKGGVRLQQAKQIRERDCTFLITAPVLAKME